MSVEDEGFQIVVTYLITRSYCQNTQVVQCMYTPATAIFGEKILLRLATCDVTQQAGPRDI